MLQAEYTIEVQSQDWVFVMENLIKRHSPDGKGVSAVIEPHGFSVTYTIPRELIPAEAVAAALGSTADRIAKVEKIVLKPLKQEGWQAPTVDYHGQA